MLVAWLCLPIANCPHEPRTVTSAQEQKGPTQSDFAASNSAGYIGVRNLVYRGSPLEVPRLFCSHGLSSVFLQALLLSQAISHPKVARLTFLWKTHSTPYTLLTYALSFHWVLALEQQRPLEADWYGN